MTRVSLLRRIVPWIIVGAILVWVVSALSASSVKRIDTSVGFDVLAHADVDQVKIVDGEQRVEIKLNKEYEDLGDQLEFFYLEPQGDAVVAAVEASSPTEGYNVEVPHGSIWGTILYTILPMILIIGIFFVLMSNLQGGGGRLMSFGRSRAKLVTPDMPKVTFDDVAGVDEAVEELREIEEFLEKPAKFQAVGAKIPRGVLLYGAPGTGKTLLARAVAGEAGVPFFSISGSDFVEMFVGVGASRVRDLFENAKRNSPSIIFVDEIDAVGRHRGAGLGGGHDEREQTLNQMLVEMDGFDIHTNVILIAATNRPDILDPALLRPGRFDRQVPVDAPDLKGRRKILEVHAKGKPIAPDVDLAAVAKRTPGFTGADLANVINEAALLTARRDKRLVDTSAIDEAIDRVIAGPQKRTRVMTDHDKKVTAYHEAGHALVAASLHHSDPVTKVTILPRGRALGYTMVMPEEDRYSKSRNQLLDALAWAMGGRVSEEIVFGDASTGAANDIAQATETAREMVTEYGMSAAIGPVRLTSGSGEVFLGRDVGHARDFSEAVAAEVDAEVRKLLDGAVREAHAALKTNRKVLDALAAELLEKETLLQPRLDEIFATAKKIPARAAWSPGKRSKGGRA